MYSTYLVGEVEDDEAVVLGEGCTGKVEILLGLGLEARAVGDIGSVPLVTRLGPGEGDSDRDGSGGSGGRGRMMGGCCLAGVGNGMGTTGGEEGLPLEVGAMATLFG